MTVNVSFSTSTCTSICFTSVMLVDTFRNLVMFSLSFCNVFSLSLLISFHNSCVSSRFLTVLIFPGGISRLSRYRCALLKLHKHPFRKQGHFCDFSIELVGNFGHR